MDDILAKSRNVPQTQQNIVHNNPLKNNQYHPSSTGHLTKSQTKLETSQDYF
jgi:hypothetical protein